MRTTTVRSAVRGRARAGRGRRHRDRDRRGFAADAAASSPRVTAAAKIVPAGIDDGSAHSVRPGVEQHERPVVGGKPIQAAGRFGAGEHPAAGVARERHDVRRRRSVDDAALAAGVDAIDHRRVAGADPEAAGASTASAQMYFSSGSKNDARRRGPVEHVHAAVGRARRVARACRRRRPRRCCSRRRRTRLLRPGRAASG